MDFAVHIKGLHEEGKGSWVLAVDGERVLISHDEDQSLHWYDIADCKLVNVSPPDRPRPVYSVQVAQSASDASKLVKVSAMPSRADRRRAERNGG